MNTHAVPGLSAAVKHYTSDKLKERSQGLEEIRDIFDSRDNVLKLHETAAEEGGAGWLAFFQCLFQVVSIEKKAVLKKGASAQADKRLSEAIGLVRRIAEKTYHFLSKKPFVALFTHLVTLLVYGRQIFPPAAIDYIKALKTLLSYPPHLESLDQTNWKIVVGVCWASLLGDQVRLSDEIDEDVEEDERDSDRDVKPLDATQGVNGHARQKTLSTINSEVAGLLPILLSSSAAPLLPHVPDKDTVYVPEPSTGMTMMLKVSRFFQQYPNDNNAHLPVLQSLNLVLAQMELNARDEMVSASVKLLPLLASLWTARKKDIREQVLIALRTMLPFATHKTVPEHDKKGTTREALSKIYEYLIKEGQLRWGCQPLDLSVIRLKLISRKGKEKEDLSPFTSSMMSAGFDFGHEYAMTWVTGELYADICYHLYDTSHSTQAMTPSTQIGNKRRRVENALSTLIANLDAGTTSSRLLHIQVTISLVERDYRFIHSEAQADLRRALLELLDSDDPSVQSWTLVALGQLALKESEFRAALQQPSLESTEGDLIDRESQSRRAEADWDRIWAHATRKIAIVPLSRAACHATTCLLASDLARSPRHLSDVRIILSNVEVQGPAFPFDSVCAFLTAAISIARNDAVMYQLGLEDKVLSWLMKWPVVEGSRGKNRMDQQSASDVYRLFCEATRMTPLPLADVKAAEMLPDCAIVERLIEEERTRPLRRLIITAQYPSKPGSTQDRSPQLDAASAIGISDSPSAASSLGALEGRPRAAAAFLTQALDAVVADWTSADRQATSPPERVRKAIDLSVVSLAYMANLQHNGYQNDSACLQSALRLLDLVKTALSTGGYSIPMQRLLWAAFLPLTSDQRAGSAIWPILLDASPQMSGICQSLFPDENLLVQDDNQTQLETQLQRRLWRDASIGPALKDILSTALGVLESLNNVPAPTGATEYPNLASAADDFGEINVAESDTMPQSREAIECRTTSASLTRALARFRVSGPMLVSPSGHPSRDSGLINAWLSTEGTRFVQLGQVICDLLQDGLLRLSIDAVDLILGALEEMAGSYAYSRNDGLLEVALAFLGHSATVWLSPEAESSDIPERVICMAKFLLIKASKGQIPSWRVRLAVLLFLDEYLDYDPAASLWFRLRDESEMIVEGAEISPFTYLTESLLDTDSRVRVRAATSSAAIFYLSGFPVQNHHDVYFQALARQPGQTAHWDMFMNHLLWKLNCCIASTTLRATAMFHLYEIPPTTTAIHQHFQAGMQAVAERLHLRSIADLFCPYAVIICLSQVGSGQKTILQPFRLYGFSTKSAFASMLISTVGPSAIIDKAGYTLFKDACEASSTPLEWATEQTMPAALALALAENVAADPDNLSVESAMSKTFTKLPGIRNSKQVQQALEAHIDLVMANVLALLDLSVTDEEVASLLHRAKLAGADSKIFARLLPAGTPNDHTNNPSLDSRLTISNIIAVHAFCHERYTALSPSKIAFAAVNLLFKQINQTFLASEELRYLRALALVATLYPASLREPIILQTFMRELISRIDKTDYPNIVIRMLHWSFDHLPADSRGLDQMPEILIELGEARNRLRSRGHLGQTAIRAIDDWLLSQVPSWTTSETLRESLDFAMAFWPTEVTSLFENWKEPSFVDLGLIADTPRAKSFSSMTLCLGLSRGMPEGNRAENIDVFGKHVFWHLKATLSENDCTSEGTTGLLDLLAQLDGEIHAPDLSTANELAVDPQAAQYTDKLAKDPATMIRAVLVMKVADLTRHKDYTLRSTALEVLRRSHRTIDDLIQRGIFAGGSVHPAPLLKLLLPSDTPDTEPKSTLDVLTQDDAWVKRCSRSDTWACQLSVLICDVLSEDDTFYRSFKPLLQASTDSASRILPWYILAVLTVGSAKSNEVASARSATLSSYFVKIIQSRSASESAIKTIIKTVLHLRGFMPHYKKGVMAFNRWLDIDPILLSEAAIRCGAFATALLFLEMLKDSEERSVDLLDPRVQEIMYQIYSNVEDPDGFYGVQTRDIKGALSKRLQHEKLSLRAFGLHGAVFETSGARSTGQDSIIPMMTTLHDMGFNRLSSSIHKSSRVDQSETRHDDPLLLDLAWRIGDWELPVPEQVTKTSRGSFYACLRSVHRQRDREASRVLVEQAVRSEIGRMGELGLEQMAQIKESATNLVCLREISLWLDPKTQEALGSGDGEHESLKRLGNLSDAMNYSVAERVSATRLSLLRAAHARESRYLLGDMTTKQTETITDLQKALHLHLGRLARTNGKLQASINAITAVQNLERGTADSDEANDEFGHVLWAQKEHALAIQHLEQMSAAITSNQKANGRLAVLLAQTAHWTSVAKMRAPQEIRATFDKAYNMMKVSKLSSVEQASVCHEYALFADSHYQALSKSPELERLRANRDRTLSVLEQFESTSKSSKSKSASARTDESRRQDVMEDEKALRDLEAELTTFAKTAMKMFATSLAASDEFDDSTTRLCSLWLEHDYSEDVNKAFAGPLQAIPTHKFLFLGPQLAARIYKPKQPVQFNTCLNKLVLRMCHDHPLHILYQLITVAQGSDSPNGTAGSSKSRRTSDVSMAEGRMPAAIEILAVVQNSETSSPLARDAAQQMVRLTNAAVPWCHHQDSEKRSSKYDFQMPKNTPLLGITNMKIPPPSVVPPVDLTRKYNAVATVQRYRTHYRVLGGIHRPKRMTCIDSTGREHYELFKGDDELRQDAVMEQVFEMTNRILSRDRKTKARNLRFRTYTVIPLPNRSGVMEFVGDSQAIGEYLKPAHTKYRAGLDHPPDHMRAKMEEIQSKDPTSSELPKRYVDIMTKFKPVMRHYFTEKHREPMAWFSMRLNYIRSVAVTSIVGHILGIGDRHCSNMLIDKLTGELVHIDFGIVFEDGRRLRIPERVPFRLTNDIVDGLGLTGVDGTFRQCSEHTLRVLRENSELILTVLEVFKHDPLYAWAADTEKLKRAQGGGRVEGQSATATDKADRVLSKIRQKLRPDLSVEYTVNQLIQEARDPENLAKIFIGWQPWL